MEQNNQDEKSKIELIDDAILQNVCGGGWKDLPNVDICKHGCIHTCSTWICSGF